MPTIEECFEIYLRLTQTDLDPLQEDEQRHAFFCGFESCLTAMDQLAWIFEQDEAEGALIVDRLVAEFEKFAQSQDSGESTVNH